MLATITVSVAAMDITVLNTGSKTGGFSVESSAYAQDLSKNHKVEFINPGQHCAAYSILEKTTTPILFPWANDFEALGRDGKGCATLKFKPEQIVRFNSDPMYVCSMRPEFTAQKFIQSGQGARVGHTTPDFAFGRVVGAVNESFGTTHRSIVYDGTGAAKTALYNGEVDYGFFTAKWVKEIEDNKGQCHYILSGEDRNGYPAIGKLDPKNKKLYGGYATVWVMFNASETTVKKIKQELQAAHQNNNSAIQQAMHGTLTIDWAKSNKDLANDWESAVNSMRQQGN